MYKFKRSFVAFAVILAIATLLAPAHAQGQGGNQQPINVSVVNTPGVKVSNPADSPVLVREVGSPAREPIQLTGEGLLGLFYEVPAGKRLVTEYASARALVDPLSTAASPRCRYWLCFLERTRPTSSQLQRLLSLTEVVG